jgi:hypothetical protein
VLRRLSGLAETLVQVIAARWRGVGPGLLEVPAELVNHLCSERCQLIPDDLLRSLALDPRQNLVAVRLGLLRPFNPRHGRAARMKGRPHRAMGDLQGPGDLADPVALHS